MATLDARAVVGLAGAPSRDGQRDQAGDEVGPPSRFNPPATLHSSTSSRARQLEPLTT